MTKIHNAINRHFSTALKKLIIVNVDDLFLISACPSIPLSTHLNVNCNNGHNVGSVCSFSCESGFRIEVREDAATVVCLVRVYCCAINSIS